MGRISAIALLLFLASCGPSRYTVKVPVSVPESPSARSPYLDGCLTALKRTEALEASYKHKLKGRAKKQSIVTAVVLPSANIDLAASEGQCTEVLMRAGMVNVTLSRQLNKPK